MAYDIPVLDVSFVAGADLSSSQYMFVKLNSSGKAILNAAAGEDSIGVLQNNPTSGAIAIVRVWGISKVVVGTDNSGVVTVMDPVATNASGQAKTAVKGNGAGITGSNVLGTALSTSTASGQIITMLVTKMGAVPTTLA